MICGYLWSIRPYGTTDPVSVVAQILKIKKKGSIRLELLVMIHRS
jgi:hypothetical protein